MAKKHLSGYSCCLPSGFFAQHPHYAITTRNHSILSDCYFSTEMSTLYSSSTHSINSSNCTSSTSIKMHIIDITHDKHYQPPPIVLQAQRVYSQDEPNRQVTVIIHLQLKVCGNALLLPEYV